MGELIHLHSPRDRKPAEQGNAMIEIPTDMMADTLARRRREHIRALPPPIEVPDAFIIPGSRQANLGAEAAKAAAASTDGRFGLGKIEVDMPADPSKVPGWDGDTRR